MSSKNDPKPKLSGTDLLHADDDVPRGLEVAPSISVTTTYKQPDAWDPNLTLDQLNLNNPVRHIYSRYTQAVSTRAEHVLSKINQGYAITYASGLAAAYAALVFFKPKRVAITGGYHGCRMVLEMYKRSYDDLVLIGIDDEFQEGDLCWVETPLNPKGICRNIQHYADKVHAVGGKLIVDATFGPPPLQYPFKWGTDIILHSGTKYFGGHSDLLCGILVVKTLEEWNQLWSQRTFLGSMMGSLESWLLLRSLRTLHLRVPKQSESATELASWLNKASQGQASDGIPAGIIDTVYHASLQKSDADGWEPRKQMEGGWNATFAIVLASAELATLLPHSLKLFIPATSLGGVESLVEHRVASDPSEDPRLIRLSIGVEEVEDLKDDLRRAFQKMASAKAKL
ncbi:cystathionine gamma-synthase [Cristinia sonorae]|uniref:Cystathionine gamma-synthase n=1 Tax=Cristinia sonorae TaxID=1940300 RepID=A0A8K0UX88_9AGAR|nr:cystathionine gamma-synthase [Cristinia sonorae]